MLGRVKQLAPFLAVLALGACNAGNLSVPVITEQSAAQTHPIPQWQAQNLAHRACPEPAPGDVQCQLLISNENTHGKVSGLGAHDIEAAYNLPSSSKGSGQIVAIVDFYDNPNVASDLAAYRRHYNLPKAKFYKYNEDGQQSHYPKGKVGWGGEIDLDTQMVSASCPNCTIYLIEGNGFAPTDVVKSETEAVKLGAHIISNSFSCSMGGCPAAAFDTPGITYVASAGDDGYGTSAPMAYATVVSAGGTILSKSGSIYNEVVWPDTGGGCATKITKPSWQHDPGCSGRTANDVAAVAWNVASYDTYGGSGWENASGTSVSAPIIAGIFGLAGNAKKQDGGKIFWSLSKKKLQADVHIIASGNNDCPPRLRGSYLCTAGSDEFGTYSGPTGWGTPNGAGAF